MFDVVFVIEILVKFLESRMLRMVVMMIMMMMMMILICVSFTIIGQPRNSVLIRRV